jgi:hypothetical protein
MMDTGSTAHYTIMVYALFYALGEAQYSGKNLRVTLFNTFLSRGRHKSKL